MSDMVRALYSPSRRQPACVIIQAIYGGDRRACQPFVGDWCVDHVDDFMMISAPLTQWQAIADLPPELRPGPEDFKKEQA